MWDTQQLRRPQPGGKKKASGQQTQKPSQQSKQQQQQKPDKPSTRSGSSGASDDHSDKERSEVSQSSPSPALSTNTNNSSTDSASPTGSPAHKQTQAEGAIGQFQGVIGNQQPDVILQTPAHLIPQQSYSATNTNMGGYYSSSYQQQQQQQQQQGIFGQAALSVANSSGLNPLMMAQGGIMGQGLTVSHHHHGLSPVMILQRGHPSTIPQTQQGQYYSGGQFNQRK